MNEGQLTRALAADNAWWRDSQWERDDRDLRPLTATTLDYEPTPLTDVAPDGLYVLRQGGRLLRPALREAGLRRQVHRLRLETRGADGPSRLRRRRAGDPGTARHQR